MASEHIKKCSSLFINKMQIDTIMMGGERAQQFKVCTALSKGPG